MMRIIAIVIIFALLIAGFFFYRNDELDTKGILAEIERIDIILTEKELHTSDFEKLKDLTHEDHIAHHYVEEMEWLFLHNQSSHITHSLGYLFNYVRFGIYKPCLPHEVEHIALYAKFNDTERLEHKLDEVDDVFNTWAKNAKSDYSDRADINERVDIIVSESRNIIDSIKQGNRSQELFRKADLVGDSGLC